MQNPLTKIQIAQLRNADSIVFRHTQGESRIEADKKANPQTGFDQTVFISTNYVLDDYAGFGGGLDKKIENKKFKGFSWISSSQYCDLWQTIASFLRAGDILTLYWIHSDNSESLESAGFSCDELRLKIERGNKDYTFLIQTAVTHRNSLGRMIKNEY